MRYHLWVKLVDLEEPVLHSQSHDLATCFLDLHHYLKKDNAKTGDVVGIYDTFKNLYILMCLNTSDGWKVVTD